MSLSISIYAQRLMDETIDDDGVIHWTSWSNNWFITACIGIEGHIFPQKLEGFSLDVAPTYDIAVGKWITPFVGLQLKYNHAPVTGYSEYANLFADSDGNLEMTQSTIHLDVLFDMFAIIKGYKYDRFYRIIPYIGAGSSIPHNGEAFYSKDYITLGLINSFRINHNWSAKLTLKTSASNLGHFGIVETYQRHRLYPINATLGVLYRFGSVGHYKQEPIVTTEYVDREVVEYVDRVVVDTISVEKIMKELYFAGSVIRFELNSSKLSKISRVNLSYIARAIKQIPGDRVFKIVGYCDVHTGSIEWNEGLSLRRAKAVYDCLVNEFGVDESRLEIDHRGGVENMFYDDNTLSRVVIME